MQAIIRKQAVQTIGFFTLFALALFIPAGTVGWVPGWVFLALFFGFFVGINAWLYRHNPGLMEERMQLTRPNQRGWDKVLFPAMLALTFGWLAFMALDAGRFHWSRVGVGVQAVGVAVLLASFYLLFLTFRENSFLSPVVRIQEERGHSVISSGPYHIVRHPMYAAILVFMVGTALALGSIYGILAGAAFMAVLGRRAVLEERTLRDELAGYADYMQQVRYRIIPFVW